MRLTVYPGGRLVLTLPPQVSRAHAENFLKRHSRWVHRALKRYIAKTKLPGGKRDYVQHREEARDLIKRRIEHFNGYFRYKFGRITIRNTTSRWGSCSKKGNLNFSYKIVYLKPELQDYIIVHELVHLRHFNHSPEFWATVRECVPDFLQLRKQLRTYVH
jgi:predicted metal-dependent hydrolase